MKLIQHITVGLIQCLIVSIPLPGPLPFSSPFLTITSSVSGSTHPPEGPILNLPVLFQELSVILGNFGLLDIPLHYYIIATMKNGKEIIILTSWAYEKINYDLFHVTFSNEYNTFINKGMLINDNIVELKLVILTGESSL